ncbi:hypothetical protein KM043_014670 [Ampulex compressa]|nr:hypothetical protein KM043_014670 [Ampulex compressa]
MGSDTYSVRKEMDIMATAKERIMAELKALLALMLEAGFIAEDMRLTLTAQTGSGEEAAMSTKNRCNRHLSYQWKIGYRLRLDCVDMTVNRLLNGLWAMFERRTNILCSGQEFEE